MLLQEIKLTTLRDIPHMTVLCTMGNGFQKLEAFASKKE